MKKVLVLLCAVALITSCNKTKVEKEKYSDGKIKSERTFKTVGDDKELIKEVHYHPNGKKYIEGSYKGNKREGYWASWYENGQLWSEGEFKDGLSEGKRTVYHPNGQLYYEGVFKAGERVGVWKFYDDAGKMINEIDYNKAPSPGNE